MCQGATFIFDNLIAEALSHNELDLDASLERSKEAVKVGGGKMLSYVVQNGASLAKRCMAEVSCRIPVLGIHALSPGRRIVCEPTTAVLCAVVQSHNALLESVSRGADKQKRDSNRFEEVTDDDNEKKAR